MTPLLVAQTNRITELSTKIAQAARDRDIAIFDFHYDGGVDESRAPDFDQHSPIFIYGSCGAIHRWARRHPKLSKWAFWDSFHLSPLAWSDACPAYMNAEGCYMTAGEFLEHTEPGDQWHLRPIENAKFFNGGLHDTESFAKLEIDPSLGIWASRPQAIAAEVRIWFVGGDPVAASQYRLDNQFHRHMDTPDVHAAVAAAREIAAVYLPLPHVVMDMARLADGSWNVIEFNSINTSGWYAVDPAIVLGAFITRVE